MASRNRILYATSGTAPGFRRESLRADHVARALGPWYDLDVLCPMIGRQGHVMDFHGARLLRVPLPEEGPRGCEALARAMARQLGDGVYEVVHARTPVEGEVALEMRGSMEFTLIYEPSPPSQLMLLMATSLGIDRLHRYIEAEERLVGSCDVLVVHTAGALELARDVRGARPRVARVPFGVDLDAFHPMPLRPRGEPALLLLGPPRSGLGDLHGLRVRQVDQPWGPELWTPESPADLAMSMAGAAACVALPPPAWGSWLDSTPFGLLEALCCSRPVVAPGLPEVRELLGEGVEPLLYDPDVPASLVRIARSVLEQPAAYEPVVESLASRVRSLFPASAARNDLLSLYAGLVPPAGDPPLGVVRAAD